MKKILWVSNHPCNEDQKKALVNTFGTHQLTELNDPRWGDISPYWSFGEVAAHIESFFPRLNDYNYVIVMGELSACLVVVAWTMLLGIPVYTPTTERKSVEKEVDGKVIKTSVFKHCRIRRLH